MKENTFDVPAYKFFVLKINDGFKIHSFPYYQSLIFRGFQGKYAFIPFENVDGLEIEEIRNLIETDEVLVLVATYYEERTNNFSINNLANTCTLYFSQKYLDDNKDKTIDKICEEYMEEDYMNSNDKTKRMYRCFFERYQDGSYEKTKERVKRLEMQSNNK